MIPSTSKTSPEKNNPGQIKLSILLKLTSFIFTPPEVTNSSPNGPLPEIIYLSLIRVFIILSLTENLKGKIIKYYIEHFPKIDEKLFIYSFKIIAVQNNISKNTFDLVMKNANFLPNVIKYDRYQPEFYEDTKTYISKRVTKSKIKKGISLYKEKNLIINEIEKKFSVQKELLLEMGFL